MLGRLHRFGHVRAQLFIQHHVQPQQEVRVGTEYALKFYAFELLFDHVGSKRRDGLLHGDLHYHSMWSK